MPAGMPQQAFMPGGGHRILVPGSMGQLAPMGGMPWQIMPKDGWAGGTPGAWPYNDILVLSPTCAEAIAVVVWLPTT